MCGICGILDYKGHKVPENMLKRMCLSMQHRGPDDEGIFIESYSEVAVGFGHRRLKIIDLSPAGHQPMANEDETVWIVFNGEVYNFKDLRNELLEKKHKFKSNTDTECIIHLYEEYGEDCVKYLRGMFAFAIWDKNKKLLMLARDRLGKKPLLYYYNNKRFCFASEFRPLLESGLINKEINPQALDYYLTLGYVPAPLTIYKEVLKLPPAHILICKENSVALKKYWELSFKNKIKIDEEDAISEVLKLLKDAVRVRLCSDVPLGAFLSGGIDSSSVVAIMSELSNKRIKTFSIGFEDSDYNELKFARNIANRFNTEHNEFIVRPEALRVLPDLVEKFGEPYADSSGIPSYYVSQQTRQYVTVALNGDGGDELFAGYERYQAMLIAEKIPAVIKKISMCVSGMLPDSMNSKNQLRRIKRFLDAASLPVAQRYLKWLGIFDCSLKDKIYSKDFAVQLSSDNALGLIEQSLSVSNVACSLLDKLLSLDTSLYLSNDLLVKVDITSMANSLEARSPFLDHKLVEFAASLPSEYKIKKLIKKYILKKAVRNLIPKENIYRRKMGFGVPVGSWFRGELKNFLYTRLFSSKALTRGYFNVEVVKNMYNEHICGRRDYSFQLWTLLMLEMWHLEFID